MQAHCTRVSLLSADGRRRTDRFDRGPSEERSGVQRSGAGGGVEAVRDFGDRNHHGLRNGSGLRKYTISVKYTMIFFSRPKYFRRYSSNRPTIQISI